MMTFLSKQPKKRIFSGIQPTGNLHIGNYLGAIKNWILLQEDNQNIYSIVDMHALTIPENLANLDDAVIEVTAAILASGISPTKSIIFNQSSVKEHAELAWVFNCIARIGWLNRMTQFKEKAGKDKEKASVGLYIYPVLMAADILLYDATHVPVGEDQKQHLELSRDIAQKFNLDYEVPNFLKVPEPLIQKKFARIMSLKDGTKKMSKSDPSDLSRINMTDTKDQIINKIKKAKTDTDLLPSTDKDFQKRPELENLLGIYSSMKSQSLLESINEFSGKNFSNLKENLTDIIVEKITPISNEINKLKKDSKFIDDVLYEGAQKAEEIASKKVNEIKKIIGF